MESPKYHILVCAGYRNAAQNGFCAKKGGMALIQKFMQEIDERDLGSDCMVTGTGCFGICTKGPVAVVYPQGVWYSELDEDKVEEICEKHLEGGVPVEEYQIK